MSLAVAAPRAGADRSKDQRVRAVREARVSLAKGPASAHWGKPRPAKFEIGDDGQFPLSVDTG
jgi:hypothetical protein